jgi:hypothetical protein
MFSSQHLLSMTVPITLALLGLTGCGTISTAAVVAGTAVSVAGTAASVAVSAAGTAVSATKTVGETTGRVAGKVIDHATAQPAAAVPTTPSVLPVPAASPEVPNATPQEATAHTTQQPPISVPAVTTTPVVKPNLEEPVALPAAQ